MDRRWSDEARTFAESVGSALGRLGGVEFARRAEADPSLRTSELAPVLDRLGLSEIDVLGRPADAQAAAAGVHAAGTCVMPWPVAEQLATPTGVAETGSGTFLTLETPKRLAHLDLFAHASAIDLATRSVRPVTVSGPLAPMPLDPFGMGCQVLAENGSAPSPSEASRAVDAHIVITAYYVLGALEAVTAMAAVYARERRQFDQPIASFGAIQWRLSDIVVALEGLTEIAGYTLWRFCEEVATPADTVGLRLAMLEAADRILSNSHQVFGAIGLCEEHDLTVIDRHLQPMLRRPGGVAATSRILRDDIATHGFDGVFPVRPVAQRSQIGV